MSLPIAINKLSTQMGLTSRTLRHWECEGLFISFQVIPNLVGEYMMKMPCFASKSLPYSASLEYL